MSTGSFSIDKTTSTNDKTLLTCPNIQSFFKTLCPAPVWCKNKIKRFSLKERALCKPHSLINPLSNVFNDSFLQNPEKIEIFSLNFNLLYLFSLEILLWNLQYLRMCSTRANLQTKLCYSKIIQFQFLNFLTWYEDETYICFKSLHIFPYMFSI